MGATSSYLFGDYDVSDDLVDDLGNDPDWGGGTLANTWTTTTAPRSTVTRTVTSTVPYVDVIATPLATKTGRVATTTIVRHPTTIVIKPTTMVIKPTTVVLKYETTTTTLALNPTTIVIEPTTMVVEPTTMVFEYTTTSAATSARSSSTTFVSASEGLKLHDPGRNLVALVCFISVAALLAFCACCCGCLGRASRRRERAAEKAVAEDIELQDRIVPNPALENQHDEHQTPEIQAEAPTHELPSANQEPEAPAIPPLTHQPLMEGETQAMQDFRRQVYQARTWTEVHEAMSGYAAEVEAAAAQSSRANVQSLDGEASGSSRQGKSTS
jgi:hypothetical protein